MRILLVSEDIPYPNMGGLAKHVLTLARALVHAGHQADLLGSDQHPIAVAGTEGKFGGQFFGELNGHFAGFKEIPLGVFVPFKRPWIARRFARIIMRHARHYDVIHYHGHVPDVALHIPADINFVQTRHDQGSDCLIHTRFRDGAICTASDPAACAGCKTLHPNALQRAVSAAAVRRFRSDVAAGFSRHKTLFVSGLLQRNLARTLGPPPWGATAHNFIDISAIEHARRTAGAMTERTRRPDALFVFVAGKLYPAKGVRPFLQALQPHLRPHMHVTVAGDGEDEQQLRAEFESRQVQFLGWRSGADTLQIAAAASAIVVPSIWEEPCATTILEGLLLGKPTFALDRGGTPELAMYAAAPGQLRLHADMQALVHDLVSFQPRKDADSVPGGLGGAERAVEKLLAIYRLPPGPLLD
ncbi:MAG: glycosyltransferase family 4 protein [Pseudomonadota bacterium]